VHDLGGRYSSVNDLNFRTGATLQKSLTKILGVEAEFCFLLKESMLPLTGGKYSYDQVCCCCCCCCDYCCCCCCFIVVVVVVSYYILVVVVVIVVIVVVVVVIGVVA